MNTENNSDDWKQAELENAYKEVCALIANTTDKDFLLDFFNCLFTASERKNIAERWLLVKGIESGLPQREIAKKYNMSLCKITRGSKELKRKDSAFLKMLEIARKGV